MTNQTTIVLTAVAAGLAGYVAGGAMSAGALARQSQTYPTMTHTSLGGENDSQIKTGQYESRSKADRPMVVIASPSRFMD
jgi:hypothetical protein